MTITPAELDSLDSVLKRAQEDWDAYYSSGYGPRDFSDQNEWRQHVRTVNGDLRRVRKLISRASKPARAQQSTQPKKGLSK